MNYNTNQVSWKSIRITKHAKLRADERLGIRKEMEIQKLAHAAKYKGIPIQALNYNNYEEFGLDYNFYIFLKNHFSRHTNADKNYYYKNWVFVFTGNGSRCLRTIVPCEKERMGK